MNTPIARLIRIEPDRFEIHSWDNQRWKFIIWFDVDSWLKKWSTEASRVTHAIYQYLREAGEPDGLVDLDLVASRPDDGNWVDLFRDNWNNQYVIMEYTNGNPTERHLYDAESVTETEFHMVEGKYQTVSTESFDREKIKGHSLGCACDMLLVSIYRETHKFTEDMIHFLKSDGISTNA